MIPIRDNLARQTRPWVSLVLIGCHLFLFLWELKLSARGELGSFLANWAVVPTRITAIAADVWEGTWLALPFLIGPLLVSLFLHSSFAQLIGNLLFLWTFGPQVEQRLGHGEFLAFYGVTGLLSTAVQITADSSLAVPLVGANGAIAAVLGAYLVIAPKAKIDSILPLGVLFIPIELPALFYLFWWFVQQGLYGVSNLASGVNPLSWGYWAHIIGLFLGIAWIKFRSARSSTTSSSSLAK